MADSRAVGAAVAWEFAFGVNPQLAPLNLYSSNTGTGSQTYLVEVGQTYTQDGRLILPLVVNGSLTVGTGATQETVVITAFSAPNPAGIGLCSFTAVFANAHNVGEPVSSGSFGVQEAAHFQLTNPGAAGGLVIVGPEFFARYASHAAGITALTALKSLGVTVTLLDYSGVPGVFSYNAAANSIYASTAHVLY